MHAQFTSLPNWLREFDSRRPLGESSQVSPQIAHFTSGDTGAGCTRGCTHLASIAAQDGRFGSASLGASEADEVPLPDEGERELVWRPGFGWVSRPVEVEQPETREVAAA